MLIAFRKHTKISVYNKIIVQYIDETNIKYSLNLKFTRLEAPEIGLSAKTYQVASHEEDQQLPKQLALPQQLESHQPP